MKPVLVILLFLVSMPSIANGTDECVQFLDSFLPLQEFRRLESEIHCLLRHGSWVRDLPHERTSTSCRMEPFSNWNRVKGDLSCSNASQSEGNLFKWHSNPNCAQKLLPFSRDHFCDILNGRNILVVGDSISEEMFFTIFTAMDAECHHPICEDKIPSQVLEIRNDRLSLLLENVTGECPNRAPLNFVECPFAKYIMEKNISILIMNRGAHYEDNEKTIADINETLAYITALYPSLSIIYRNTPHGHLNDTIDAFFSPPLLNPPKIAEEIRLNYETYGSWNYDKFHQQNVAVHAFLYANYPQILNLDFFTSTILRQDSHYDNLHYCMPGPIDTWVRTFLYNALRIMSPPTQNQEHTSTYSRKSVYSTLQECEMVVDSVLKNEKRRRRKRRR